MKTFLRNSVAICLAFLVLFSTMSLTINEHYCGDTLVNSTLFAKAESCGMEIKNPSPSERCTIKMKDCCKDVSKLIEGQDTLKIDYSKLDLQQQVFIAAFIHSYISLYEGVENKPIPFKYYSPPLLVKDIQVLDETYLI